nr:beta-lactamase family protein [Nocardiopsis sp. JB363]
MRSGRACPRRSRRRPPPGGGLSKARAAFARLQLVENPPILDAAVLGEARTGAVERSPGREYGLGWWDAPVPGVDEPVVWHGGSTPGFAAMMLVLPERERAVVVLQNGYDQLRDGEIQAVGFGLAHLLTGGDTPVEPRTNPWGPALVWGVTAAIPLSVAGAVAAAAHLRRGRARRRWMAWAWSLFAASSVAATVALSVTNGARGVAVVRRGRGNRRPRPDSVR